MDDDDVYLHERSVSRDYVFNRYEGALIELGKVVERIEREREAAKERENYLLRQLQQTREGT